MTLKSAILTQRTWKILRREYSGFLINVPQWKENMFVQTRQLLWQKNCIKQLWKDKNEINRNNNKVQRNYCKKLLENTKKKYFNNLNTSKVTDNRTFWKAIVPLFTNKPYRGEKVILKEGNKNITNDAELCEVFNTYFSNIVASLNIPNINNYKTAKENAKKHPQQIKCFKTHPSITTITKQCLSYSFNF